MYDIVYIFNHFGAFQAIPHTELVLHVQSND